MISEQIALTATFYFGKVYVFCRLINKNVLEWFLLIMCKEHSLRRSTNLFSRNHPTLFLIKKRMSADVQCWTITLSNWQKQSPEVFCNIQRETPVLESFLNKVAGLYVCNFIKKKKLQHRCFPVNIANLLRAPILKNICIQLLLNWL